MTATPPPARDARAAQATWSNRALCLDGLRVFSIFCVVLLHTAADCLTAPGGSVTWFTGAILVSGGFFCVPALLMISGALLLTPPRPTGEITPGQFYRKRLPKLIWPLLLWSFLYYVRNHYTEGTSVYLPTFFKRVLTVSLEGHLWYLYMLVGVYTLIPFLKALRLDERRDLGWWLAGLTFGFHGADFLARAAWGLPLYHHLPDGFLTVFPGYLILGRLLWTAPTPSPRRLPALLLAFAAGWGGTVLLLHRHALLGHTSNVYLTQISPLILLMSWAIFQMFQMFRTPAWSERHWPPRAAERLAGISALSYGIYLMHILVLHVLQGKLPFFAGLDLAQWPAWSRTLTLTGATFLLSAILTAGIRRVPGLRILAP